MDMMWIAIAAMACTGIYFDYKAKEKKYSAKAHSHDELTHELDALKARIETLETLVTDRSYQVRKEIDSL